MKAELYTRSTCPHCQRAKALLEEKGIEYVEHEMDDKLEELDAAKQKYGHGTVPIVILDGELVGGASELAAKLG